MTKKEIEAAIKPEFMAKLKKLRIKTKFMNNVMDPKWPTLTFEEHVTRFLKATTWGNFINHHCYWYSSPEGHAFWYNIYSK